MAKELLAALRVAALTLLLCALLYPALLLGGARLLAPDKARGQLIERDGVVVGARPIAQGFTAARYIWPRPSAVAYAADAAGGSNLSPANPAIAERAQALLAPLGADAERPAPAELVLASGSGLDPQLTLAGARYQAARAAAARGVDEGAVLAEIEAVARVDGTFDRGLVNVLLLNLRLDERFPLSR